MNRAPRLGDALVTVGGLGRMRPASGTWGSLPPVVALGLLTAVGASAWVQWGVLIVLVVAFSLACVVHGDWAEAAAGRKDPGDVVADETAGMALTLMFVLPWGLSGGWRGAVGLGIAFVLFRVMDIIKPPPARGLQRMPAGWGILVDDLIAGVYAGAAWLLVAWLGWMP